MRNVVIIKTGASGDVVRTTVLLHFFTGNVYWIVDPYNISLFPDNYPGLTLIPSDNIPPSIFHLPFDLVINLEEDKHLAKIAGSLKTNKLTGVYLKDNSLHYTSDSAAWFDMSLISAFGKEQADLLKEKNRLTYQEILLGMIGKTFNGEKYILHRTPITKAGNAIKLESHVGKRWPNKQWYGYEELKNRLSAEGRNIVCLNRRENLRSYLDDISSASLVITGDTLAMHVALAYEIPCIAIFNCTSPHEIYDYGILKKICSPLLYAVFYQEEFNYNATSAIGVSDVENAVNMMITKIS